MKEKTVTTFPVFFVILVSLPLGRLLARILPKYTVPLGRFSFSLNPGPFSIKEHVIIGIAANSGSQGQWASMLTNYIATVFEFLKILKLDSLFTNKRLSLLRHHYEPGRCPFLWFGKSHDHTYILPI